MLFLQINVARTCVYDFFVVSLHAYFEIYPKFLKIMNKISRLMVALTLVLACAGCVTQKQMTYLSDAQPGKADAINASYETKTELVVRPGDALSIVVSALDQEAIVPYNLPLVVYAKPGERSLSTTPTLQCYTVDEEGNIDFPVLGKLHVAGLKRSEVEQMIKQRLEAQVLNPIVTANIIGAKVSVMGEVVHPCQVTLPNGHVTVLDALAAAGDLTPYGRRDNVLVTREVDGKMQIARLNLGSTDIYSSPYFYLQQNDVVYVSPNKVRAVASANTSVWLGVVSAALSAATIVVTVLK